MRPAQMLPAKVTAFSRRSSALLAVALDELATARLLVGELEVVEGLGGFLRSSRGQRVLPCQAGRRFTENRRHAVARDGGRKVETG